VVEIGCGPIGGFVPMLHASGYDAVGVDPEAPEGPEYRRVRFEDAEFEHSVDAVVACTSLHHVADPERVLDRIVEILRPTGALVVVEWAWEAFDERTAAWCFERLEREGDGWLHRRRDEWARSQEKWAVYLRDWATREGLHRGETLLRELDRRFDRLFLEHGPYFFSDLPATSEAEERAAIAAHRIRAARIDYLGRPALAGAT
jgi:SAM-dependent methyltransferase